MPMVFAAARAQEKSFYNFFAFMRRYLNSVDFFKKRNIILQFCIDVGLNLHFHGYGPVPLRPTTGKWFHCCGAFFI